MDKSQAIEILKKSKLLPERWTPLRPHPVQNELWTSLNRFKVVPAGRRSGKTELAKRRLIKSLPLKLPYGPARYFAAAPTNDQARRIYWDDLKALTPKQWLASRPNESRMIIKTIFGSEIEVVGLDKPERIEGSPWDGGIIDEIGNVKAGAWQENVRPALSDRNGWCWLIGVPEGRNHYYDLYEYARISKDPEWGAFTWFSADILPASEIAAAKRELDPRTYRQEYEASFESYEGTVYYNFSEKNIAQWEYQSRLPVCLRFDFNETPMSCTTAQVTKETYGDNRLDHVHVFDEISIRSSNTVEVCNELINRFTKPPVMSYVYGNAYGNTSTTGKTDYQIVQEMLSKKGWKLEFRIPSSNPSVVDRTNSVNAMLCSIDGYVRTTIDPRCRELIQDFQRVTFKEGTRVINKDDPDRTHWSDGHGYHVHLDYPVKRYERVFVHA
jgi:hypothetical protein